MTYLGFLIRKKYKYLKNVLEKNEMDNTSNLSSIEKY